MPYTNTSHPSQKVRHCSIRSCNKISEIAMTFTAVALYPNDEGSHFDHDYYVNKHSVWVGEELKKSWGLIKWEVIKFGPGPDGAPPKYHVMTLMTFSKPEDMAWGTSDIAKEFAADIKNYTNVMPTGMGGSLIGSG